jgi:hypothetical protein
MDIIFQPMQKDISATKDDNFVYPLNAEEPSLSNKNKTELKLCHQNIRGIRKKTSELQGHLYPDYPHILCFSELHLNYLELKCVHIENNNLGAYYCRMLLEKGGVAIYVHNSLNFTNIDLVKQCEDQHIVTR